ncbi:hypothetical protein ONE63_004643 [Megalurothrips usitatus]|uniref:Uncharacterized protein n=1 Tax=Megalurothrips usitatus TaxID=439358 RepID=A0AAV7X4C0_9NEOP|nr:hypothetical protein ONE63_004643 [Megalurothrips usitatus]
MDRREERVAQAVQRLLRARQGAERAGQGHLAPGRGAHQQPGGQGREPGRRPGHAPARRPRRVVADGRPGGLLPARPQALAVREPRLPAALRLVVAPDHRAQVRRRQPHLGGERSSDGDVREARGGGGRVAGGGRRPADLRRRRLLAVHPAGAGLLPLRYLHARRRRRHPVPVHLPAAAERLREGGPGRRQRHAHLPLPHLLHAQPARAQQRDAVHRCLLLREPLHGVPVAGGGRRGAQHVAAAACRRPPLGRQELPDRPLRPLPHAQQLHRADDGRGPRALLVGPVGGAARRDARLHGRRRRGLRRRPRRLAAHRQQARQPQPGLAAAGGRRRPRAPHRLRPGLRHHGHRLPRLAPLPSPPSPPTHTHTQKDCVPAQQEKWTPSEKNAHFPHAAFTVRDSVIYFILHRK